MGATLKTLGVCLLVALWASPASADVSAKAGTFNVTTAAAGNTVQITSIGFTPTAILLWWDGRTTAGSARGNSQVGFGACKSSTMRFAANTRATDSSASSDEDYAHSEAGCMISQAAAGTIDGILDCNASCFTSGTVTFDIDDAFPNDYLVNYLVLGGDADMDITRFTAAGVAPCTDCQTVTLATGSFTPTAVIFVTPQVSVANPPDTGANSGLTLGMTDGTNQATVSINATVAASTDTFNYAISGEVLGTVNASGSITNRATIFSLGSSNIHLSWPERAASLRVYAISLKGVLAKVGTLTTQTDLVTGITTGSLGFNNVRAGLVMSHGNVASTSDTSQAHASLSVGAFSSTTVRSVASYFNQDALPDTEVTISTNAANVYQHIDSTDAVIGAMDVQSIGTGTVTYIMTDADPTGEFAFYLAIGDNGAGATRPCMVGGGLIC